MHEQTSQELVDNITCMHYQLQNYSNKNIVFNSRIKCKENDNIMFVIDYSSDGSAKNKFKKYQIKKLKNLSLNKNKKELKRNLVISYISIGEAESYRYYFKTLDKQLLLNANKEFNNNFNIKYYDKKWQQIFLDPKKGYLKQIIEQGFDGIYLDIVDAFSYYPEKQKSLRAKQMLSFIQKISLFTRLLKPNFVIIQQNAIDILDYLKNKNDRISLLKIINGISIESLFFRGTKWQNNIFNPDNFALKSLQPFTKAKKKIFSVEYIKNNNKIQLFKNISRKYNFIPVFTTRELDY